jgi:hypothetical protein
MFFWCYLVGITKIIEKRGLAFQKQNKVIRDVRKRRHRNPLFGHIGDGISKNGKKKVTGL